jgi:hypothetical protein
MQVRALAALVGARRAIAAIRYQLAMGGAYVLDRREAAAVAAARRGAK